MNLRGIGAHLPNGPGPSGVNYYNEILFNKIENTNVLHLRPGMFYSNFYGALDLINQQNIIGNNSNENVVLALSHPLDIANAIHSKNFEEKPYKYALKPKMGQNLHFNV